MTNAANASNVKTYTVSQIAVKRGQSTGKDATRAAKEVRARLRANFSTVVELQPDILKVKDSANDGNRWPSINEAVVEALNLTRTRK